MRVRQWVVAIIVLWAALLSLHADTIYLLGGEKLIGKVISDEKTKVVFKSQTLGRMEISRDRIERVEFDPTPGAQSVNPESGKPFTPAPPKVTTAPAVAPTNSLATAATTNAPSKHRWFWQRKLPAKEEDAIDWIQLKSGEWLRGHIYGMQNRKLEFDSDELDDLEFDWKDVHQVISPKALVSYRDRDSAWGSLHVDRETVTVTGVGEEVKFPRFDLVGIAPGSPRELDYWSGRFNVGLNLRSGNTEQADLVTKIKLERRTPITHLEFDYIGNYSSVNDEETVNNQRSTVAFDVFLTRRLFLRVPFAEYYHDLFQNIDYRLTVASGMGYYLIDRPKVEWLVAGGPGYQFIRFDTVEPGEPTDHSTPAFVLQSNFDIELTQRTDLEIGYQAMVVNENSGGVTQNGSITFEIDVTRRIDLDISFIWDRIGTPEADSSGTVPQQNDFRMNLSLGVKF